MSEWRPVIGHEVNYEVSDEGAIRSRPRPRTKGGVLKLKVNKRGYLAVTLVTDGKQQTCEVHRLVAAAFLGPRPDGHQVRHLDGDRLNSKLPNLAYGTASENQFDKRRHGTDHNVSKTHCSKGHPYSAGNTYVPPSRPTARYCRECSRSSSLARYHAGRQRAA